MTAHRQQAVEQGEQGEQQEQQDPELGQHLDQLQAVGCPGQPDLGLAEQHRPLQHQGEPIEEPLLQLRRQPHLHGLAEQAHQAHQQDAVQHQVQRQSGQHDEAQGDHQGHHRGHIDPQA
ncbi:hypothetical protein D3C80_1539080 [compost metagenome]